MSNYPEQPKTPPKITQMNWRGAKECTTYEVDGSYVVADKDGFWLPGLYDSHTTARDAVALGRDACHALNEAANTTGRVITLGDVKAWRP